MKIAVPVENGVVSGHFGHAPQFAFMEVSDRQITKTEIMTPPPHEPGVLPKWLGDSGATHVLCGGIGKRAVELLQASGIEVIAGIPSIDASKAVSDFLAGELKGISSPTCSGHSGEGHGCHSH